MSMLMITGILIGAIVAICLLLNYIHQKQKKLKTGKLFAHFNTLGSELNLRFSSQEIIKSAIIGIDGVQRRVLYAKLDHDDVVSTELIHLDEVKHCALFKNFGIEQEANSKATYIQQIQLEFQFKDGRTATQITFFDHVTNSVYELMELEQKARHWEQMLGKMLRSSKPVKINHKS